MRKWYMLFMVAVLLFAMSACDTAGDGAEPSYNTGITDPTDEIMEETLPTVPSLESSEYWDVVQDEIITMLNSHNLYVSAINSSYPCVLFDVEPGKQTDDGKIVAVGLSQEQYEELYQSIKEELHIILDKYTLAKPKTALHACDSVVGIYFYNWFLDESKVSDRVESLQVASYQLDLLDYYHEYEEETYMRMEGFLLARGLSIRFIHHEE